MTTYIELDPGSDQSAILTRIVDRLKELIPGWELHPGSLENVVLDPVTSEIAGVLDVVSEMGRIVFAEIGALRGIHRKFATAATGSTLWTFTNTSGHVIEAGTQLTLLASDGSRVGFETINEVIVSPGQSTATVEIVAIRAGADGSGLSADPQPEAPLSFVASVTMEGETAGGSDAEEEEDYLDRLVAELRLPDRVLVTAENFEIASRNVEGVHRAVAIDGYDPVDNTLSNPGEITVFPVDEEGANVPASVKTDLTKELGARRLVNLVVYVTDPQRVVVNVTFSFSVYPSYDPAQVKIAGEEAVANLLSPARWGVPPFAGESTEWLNKVAVRRWEVISVLESVPGLDNVLDVQLNGSTADVSLTTLKPVGMPTVGTVIGTVVA